MARRFKAADRAIAELLAPHRRFVVPPFQRPYAWNEDEALTLLADIRAAIEQAAVQRDDAAIYFLGPVILVKSAGETAENVIDGHQRLTTLTILLALLRDLDPEPDQGVARELDQHIRAGANFTAGQVQRLLAVRPLDSEFFQRSFQIPGGTLHLTPDTPVDNDAQTKMLRVALAYRAVLEGMSAESRRWLGEFIRRCCYVVEVSAPYQDQGFDIFTRMHSRGKDLTDADLLKSEIIGALPPEKVGYFARIWEQLEADLGAAAFVQLFSHIRMIHRPKKPRRAIAFEIRETLSPTADPAKFVERELEPKARAFRQLSAADLKLGAQTIEANRLLTGLQRIRHKDWMTAAIAYFADRRPRGDEGLKFLTALDRMTYALALQSADENLRLARFGPVIEAARDGATLEALLEKMDLTANEKRIARQVLNGAIYQKERIRVAVLLRIDEYLSERVARYDVGQVSVEHILPQNPSQDSFWMEQWPSAGDRKRWTDKLGNLTLLSREKNNEARNFEFSRKKREYFAKDGVTPFVLTTQILLEREWTPEVVARRHRRLFDAACRLWDL